MLSIGSALRALDFPKLPTQAIPGFAPAISRKLMHKYDFSRDQHHFAIRIGIERPVTDMVRNFFIPGQARLHLPRVSVGDFCTALAVPAYFLSGDKVPVIYMRRGSVHFGSAKWGIEDRYGANPISVQKAERRSLGYPALIPATSIDMALEPQDAGKPEALRLRPAFGETLYIGCTYRGNPAGDAETVAPLVCGAGDDIAPYADWQPLLIRIAGAPRQGHFDFLLRRDHGRLQVPSESRTVKTEVISLAAAA